MKLLVGVYPLLIIVFLCSCLDDDKIIKVEYYTNGNKKLIVKRDSNNINKKCFQYFYEDESLKYKYCKTNNKYDGIYESYYPNHHLALRKIYSNGQLEGKSEAYFENGQLYSYAHFVNNIRNGELGVYDQKGNLIYTNFLINDFAHHVRKNTYDSLGNILNSHWDYVPRIELNHDIFNIEDTLTIKFHLPLPDSIFDRSDVFVRYNILDSKIFNNTKGRAEIYDITVFEKDMSNGFVETKLLMTDPGIMIFYGLLISRRDRYDRLYRPFIDTLIVLPNS